MHTVAWRPTVCIRLLDMVATAAGRGTFSLVSPSLLLLPLRLPALRCVGMDGRMGTCMGGRSTRRQFCACFLVTKHHQPANSMAGRPGRGRGAVMRVLSPSVIRIWWHDTIPVWTGIIRRHFLCVTGPSSPLRPGSRFGVRCSSKKAGLRGLVRLDRGVVWTLENGRKLKKRIYVLISK
jgi:hypothetical protein